LASTPEPIVDDAFVRGLPKAEIHVHLEGCFDLADLMELVKAAGVHLGVPAARLFDVEGIAHHLEGVSNFLTFLDWEGGLVRTPEQAARAAYRFAARESSSGVRYADLIFNPTHWAPWQGRLGALVDALSAGLDDAEADGLCPTSLCLSLLRQQSASDAAELVDFMIEARPRRVVALSIDGNEHAAGRTSGRFADAFARARAPGYRATVHAGESSGPEGVWDAIDVLGADRVDHGVRAVEDPELVKTLVDRQIPLGTAPRSNLILGIYPDRASHPVERLRTAGVLVSVNTDDPAPLGFRLEAEVAACAGAFGWGREVVADLARTSVRASFAPPELKAEILADIDTYLAAAAAAASTASTGGAATGASSTASGFTTGTADVD
jgi:adenosine deaminase